MFFICEVFAALKTFFFTVFTDGILGRTLKYFCLLQKQNIFLQKCYSTQSTNMNKRIRQKCFSEILFSVSDQVKKRKIKRLLLFFSSVYFDPNILSLVFKTKSIKLKKTFFSSPDFFWSDMKKSLKMFLWNPFFVKRGDNNSKNKENLIFFPQVHFFSTISQIIVHIFKRKWIHQL